MTFEFTQDCITGIETIDDEHRNLFALLSKAYVLACTEYHSDYYQELKNILEELDDYAETHFVEESLLLKRFYFKLKKSSKIG